MIICILSGRLSPPKAAAHAAAGPVRPPHLPNRPHQVLEALASDHGPRPGAGPLAPMPGHRALGVSDPGHRDAPASAAMPPSGDGLRGWSGFPGTFPEGKDFVDE